MKVENLFRDWEAVEDFDAGAVIFSEREPAEFVYVILSGEVELTLQGTSLGTEGQGGIVGEMAVFEAGTRSATATAKCPTSVARLDRDEFHKLARKHPKFSLHAMTTLADRLRAVDRFISTRLEP
jgi:CRP/FNR family cyclic AMP-dependent transcriptional regulator